jgi:S-adenosylhomocysteine hydrolase
VRLRLYDVLNYLKTPQGERLLQPIEARTRELAMLREHDPLLFWEDGQSPRFSSFEVDVLEHVYDENPNVMMYRSLPMGVISALAKAADADGTLAIENVRTVLGVQAANLIGKIATALPKAPKRELPINTKYETGDKATIELIARSIPRTYGRERMPLLNDVTKMIGPNAFSEWSMASLSHLFATRPALYLELEEGGLDRQRHLISGKGYSRNMDVVMSMRADGWKVDDSLLLEYHYDKKSHHDHQRAVETLKKLFAGVDPTSKEQFLLLDDGANLCVALHTDPELRKYAHMCRVVEQTDHGMQRIEQELLAKNIPLLCPVVDVARSDLKKKVESILIGEAVAHSIDVALHEIHPKLKPTFKEAAMLGFGAVNTAVVDALLRRGFQKKDIWVWDKNPEKMKAAEEAGFSVGTREDVLRHGCLTVSATGQLTLSTDEYDLLPVEAIVVNAGSGNHELGMNELDVDETEVADLIGGRRYTRVAATPNEKADTQLGTFINTALGQLELRESMDRKRFPRTVALLGYNDEVKAQLAKLEQAGFPRSEIVVADVDAAQRAAAERDGLRVVDRETALRHGTLVLSDGPNVLAARSEMEKLREGAIHVYYGKTLITRGKIEEQLAGDGRRTTAQRAAALREDEDIFRGYMVNNAAVRAGKGYRHRVVHTGTGNDVLVLRSGFVINMETGIPPEYVQLILSMLQMGLYQATQESTPGIKKLEHQDFLEARFRRHLKAVRRSLERPSFKGLAPAI